MQIRKILQKDLLEARKISSIAFEWTLNDELYNETIISEEKDTYIWAAFEDNGKMMGSIGSYPFIINFDGNIVNMSGIGGVSTLPAYRKNGVIKECFKKALNEMNENNQLFSVLFPFSAEYYRKFGYEVCSELVDWEFPLSSIDGDEINGSIHMFEPGNDFSDYISVYNEFSKRYNLSIVRENHHFKRFYNLNPYKDKTYIYLYKNSNGEPKGYIIFTKENESIMRCHKIYKPLEMCFIDTNGLIGLLRFAKVFSPSYKTIHLGLPSDIRLESFINEQNHIKRQTSFLGMVRAINVLEVLKLASYRGSGNLIIKISDTYCPWNHNTFEVKFLEGKSTFVDITDTTPHISMNISDFSRLIIGSHNKEDLYMLPNVTIHNDNNHIEKVFYKKRNWFIDYF